MSSQRGPGIKTPGEMVYFSTGISAGRYRCENAGCPATVPISHRDMNDQTQCFYCQEYGQNWWNLSVQQRKERVAGQESTEQEDPEEMEPNDMDQEDMDPEDMDSEGHGPGGRRAGGRRRPRKARPRKSRPRKSRPRKSRPRKSRPRKSGLKKPRVSKNDGTGPDRRGRRAGNPGNGEQRTHLLSEARTIRHRSHRGAAGNSNLISWEQPKSGSSQPCRQAGRH